LLNYSQRGSTVRGDGSTISRIARRMMFLAVPPCASGELVALGVTRLLASQPVLKLIAIYHHPRDAT